MPIVLSKRLQVTCVNVLPDVIVCRFLHLNAPEIAPHSRQMYRDSHFS